jgi:toxin ParE1/3/4
MADRRYILSGAAVVDLGHLYDRGIDHFGLTAADQYYHGLIARFEQIADSPQLWPAVEHIRAGYRRSVYRAHSIFYRIETTGVLIVRVLGRESPAANLPDVDGLPRAPA